MAIRYQGATADMLYGVKHKVPFDIVVQICSSDVLADGDNVELSPPPEV